METSGKHVDRESEVFKKLKGKFKHFCQDWDMMAIDETCPEFEACHCFDKLNEHWDKMEKAKKSGE